MVYAYLQKVLPFAEAFDVLPEPLEFHTAAGTVAVASFGTRRFEDHGPRAGQLKEQMSVLDYAHDEDFVIELLTRSKNDRMILAKCAPHGTLQETIDETLRRVAAPGKAPQQTRLLSGEALVVPRILLGVKSSFEELCQDFLNPELAGNDIKAVFQTMRFRLDETGAVLISEVEIVGENGHEPSLPGERQFIFDRPFLLLLIERDADQPYFAMWIENEELLEPVK